MLDDPVSVKVSKMDGAADERLKKLPVGCAVAMGSLDGGKEEREKRKEGRFYA